MLWRIGDVRVRTGYPVASSVLTQRGDHQLQVVDELLEVESTPPEDRERAHREAIATEHSLGAAVDRFLAALPASTVRQ